MAGWRVHPLIWVVVLALVHGSLYAAIVPPWQAPDESVHYQYLVALDGTPDWFPDFVVLSPEAHRAVVESQLRFRFWDYNNWTTPAEVPALPEGQEYLGRAGGLYYRLASPVLALVRAWPIEAQLSALRVYSLLWMALTVAITYALAREVFPAREGPEVLYPLAAAATVAIFPQYTFIAASFNDDNLVPPLAGFVLLAVLRVSRSGSARAQWGWWAGALAAGALAVLAKRTGAVAAVVALGGMLVLAVRAWQAGGPLRKGMAAVVVGLAVLGLVAGIGALISPPLLPNEIANRLRVDPEALIRLVAEAQARANQPWQAWYPQVLFLSLSFWGWFGYLTAPLSLEVISVVRYLSVILVLGLGVATLSLLARWRSQPAAGWQTWALALLTVALAGQLGLMLAQHLIDPRFYSLTGRYLFPFISAFAILAVWGWSAWWPGRLKPAGVLIGLGLLLALDVYALTGVMLPFWYS